MCNLEAEAVNAGPAPSAPCSQSHAARRVQEIERHLGPVIDLVVQRPQNIGLSLSSTLLCNIHTNSCIQIFSCSFA
jgi:hypothetical protein